MEINARPGQPFDDIAGDYPPPTPGEAAAAAVQAAQLSRCTDDVRTALTELYRRLIERRGDRQEWLRSPTDAHLAVFADETALPLLTLDELLVRTRDLNGDSNSFRTHPMRDLLTGYDLNENPVAELDNRVTRLRNPNLDAQRLAGIGKLLRRHGYQATMNHCEPLGYVTKSVFGEVGPEPSDRPVKPTYPGTPKPPGWADVAVAVLDTGITDQPRTDGWLENIARDNSNGPDNNIDPLYQIAGPPRFDYGAGHGSFVAGVVQQTDPYADIRSIKVLGYDGIAGDVEVAIGIWIAVQQGATILNLSLGTETADNQPPLATLVALELIAERRQQLGNAGTDVVLVAAAGNNRNTRPVWPAAFSATPTIGVTVVSVAGLTTRYEPADFSTHGFWVTCSTAANGVLSTFAKGEETPDMDPVPDHWVDDNPWAVWTGTSFAAPQVTGAIARRCQETGDTPTAALTWLLGQGVNVPDYGRTLRILPIS